MKIVNDSSFPINNNHPHRVPQRFADDVDGLIANTPVLPGATVATANIHRAKMEQCKNILMSTGNWSQQQHDADNRNVAVGMQAMIETALLNELARDPKARLSIIVHTNNPPTPLCACGDYTPLFHPSIRGDLAVESTVTSRIKTNENFLRLGNQVSFCSLYGAERAVATEQAFFDEKVRSNPGLFAVQTPEPPPVDLSGATYLYANGKNEKMVIGVRITQANIPSENCSLFVGRDCRDGKVGKYLVPLGDYIHSAQQKTLSPESTFQERKAYFELMAISHMIS
ncbi:TPA: hypothetical protein ACH1J3_002884 [Citrobacter werkmanii]